MLKAEPADSLAHAEELGDAIRMLRANGKKVICHLEDAAGPLALRVLASRIESSSIPRAASASRA